MRSESAPRSGIKPKKKSTLVAQQIIEEIVGGNFQVGQKLPPEAEMCANYDVGRSTIREALRLLESQGVVSIKTGPGGGPVLSEFDAGFLAANIALMMQLSGSTFRDVMNARLVLEPAIAGAAAEHADPETIERLHALAAHGLDPELDSAEVVADGGDFHDVVAAGSGNVFFEHLLLALHRITEPFAMRLPYEGARRDTLLQHHRELAEAIASGDRDIAAEAMRVDLLEFIDYAEQQLPQLLGERIDWGRINA